MPRKASMTVTGKAKMTPVSPTADEPSPTAGAAKSGQYPGLRQNEGEAEAAQMVDHLAPATSVRGVDPALAGSYVHSARSNSQGRAPGKDQVKNPNEPMAPSAGGTLGAAGGQFPGIPVTINYSEFDEVADPEENLAGATKAPQSREGMVGATARHYPGVPQTVEGLAGQAKSSFADNLGIELPDNVLNPREVPENDQNLGGRKVEGGEGTY
jgi:hypothetical protein